MADPAPFPDDRCCQAMNSSLTDLSRSIDAPARILVVEDDASLRALLSTLLEREGFDVITATDGEAGLRAVAEHEPDVLVLDVGLPRLDGLEVTRRLRAKRETRTLPVILVTARASIDDMVAGLDAGADDFIGKPFKRPELLARVRSAVRMRRATLGMETAQSVVAALANAVEAKDLVTEEHCERLALVAASLGQRLGLGVDEREAITYGALLHDVGKIGVPEAILSKPGPLTEDEWVVLRRHPEIGERICRPLGLSRQFSPIVRHHHEHWDGEGYPDRLRGEAIPIGARIVGLADAFDAMTHDRPYRPALSIAVALDELRRHAGRQFDPDLVEPFIACLESLADRSEPGEVLELPRVASRTLRASGSLASS
jgi:putative two-component system response regulator